MASFKLTRKKFFVMTTDTAPKIIVVDDDPAIRTLVHRFLNHKYQVDSPADGETALALFEKLKPLLVVLDWNWADTTGYYLCQEMQRRTNVFAIVRSPPHRRS
jgi:two-component system alkaline phosphatase synthesis response regulator PhoP